MSPFVDRYLSWLHLRARVVVLALATSAIMAAFVASHLGLLTDMAELLPADHPAVVALRNVSHRQRSASYLAVLVHAPRRSDAAQYAERLRVALSPLVPRTFTELEDHPDRELPAFARKQRWLYVPQPDLDEAESLLDRIIAKRSSPLAVDIDGDPEAQLDDLRHKLDAALPAEAPDRFASCDAAACWVGLRLWRGRDGLASAGDREALAAVRAVVAALPRSSELRVEFTGPIAQAVEEQDGIRDDLGWATLVCTSLVLLVIWLYFRSVVLVLLVGAPALLGLSWALALAAVTLHALNVNTAFLVSIIVGNGINTPIVLLARLVEERRRGLAIHPALSRAITGTGTGTGLAMAAASVAYGSLLVTRFRGFSQFGFLGGAGMLLVWVATYLFVPPTVLWVEARWPGITVRGGRGFQRAFTAFARTSARHAMVLALASFALLVSLGVPLQRYAHDALEWDFHALRTDETASQRLWPRMEQLGMGSVGAGYIGNSAVMWVPDANDTDAVAEALRKQDATHDRILKTVRTISSVLPPDQANRLLQLARLRRKLDRRRDLLSNEERANLDAIRPPDDLRVLGATDLPRKLREAFTEPDGTRGRLIGIDADYDRYSDWNGHDLLRMSNALSVNVNGQRHVAASAATVFAGMLETLVHDGPRVTAVAIAGVLVITLAVFGVRGALPVLGSVFLGIAWLGGGCRLLGLRINFMNFVALPITLGVGADYAANLWARLRKEGAEHLVAIVGETGSAVALCSLTTTIGYSSLLLSHNRALRSFGLLADLGEVACLLAALVALPAGVQVYAWLMGTKRAPRAR